MATQRQIEANRRNRAKRRGLTDAGRQRLRDAAREHRPWQHSTGPRTPEGKRRSRGNARKAGEHNADHRARLAWLWAFQQFFSLWSGSCVAVCGDPRGPRADATMGKLEARLRQTSHLLPADLDTDTATAWLAEHRRLGTLPPPEDDLPLFLLAYAYAGSAERTGE